MEGRPKRRLVVTVRAAADLSEPAGSAYVALTLGSEPVETDVARIGKGTVNPVGVLRAGRRCRELMWGAQRGKTPAAAGWLA